MGQTYDRDLADVFAIQSEIAKAIADQLQAKLSPNEKKAIEQPPTTDLAAFAMPVPSPNWRECVSCFIAKSYGRGVGSGCGVGVGLGVIVGVGVGVRVGCTSKAPMSIRPFTTRLNSGPRWSNSGRPASIAGLPTKSACVKVGPPLFCNRPSIGFVLI